MGPDLETSREGVRPRDRPTASFAAFIPCVRTLSALCSVVFTSTATSTATATARVLSVEYVVSIDAPSRQQVDVSLRLQGLAPDQSTVQLAMSERPSFVRLPVPLLEGRVRATAGVSSADTLSVLRLGPYLWEIPCEGREAITVTWQVPLAHRSSRDVREASDLAGQPYLDLDHGILTTGALFLVPINAPFTAASVLISLPEGWDAYPPWPHRPGDSATRFAIPRKESLVREAIPVGVWSMSERESVRVWSAGDHAELAAGRAEIQATLGRVLARPGWPGPRRAEIVFTRADAPGASGQALTNSIVLSIDPRMLAARSPDATQVAVHELLHAADNDREMASELRWFEEGVTDYLAHRLLAEEHVITWDQFAATLAAICLEYEVSPRRDEQSLAWCGRAFFDDPEAASLVYGLGALIGAWLDLAMRDADGDGETVDPLFAFSGVLSSMPSPITPQQFAEAIAGYLTPEQHTMLREFVEQRAEFDPVRDFRSLGVEIDRQHVARPDRGDDMPPLQAVLVETQIVDLRRDDLAHLLGLRPMDRLLVVNGRGVTDEQEVREAWRQPRGGRVQVVADRMGRVVAIDRTVPPGIRYSIDPQPWRERTR